MRKAVFTNFAALDHTGNESLNTICSNLSFSAPNLKKVLFTSCMESEGKSFMTMQIMRNLAKRGKRVVLVDVDLRRSFIVSKYGFQTTGEILGLTHYLAGYCDLESIIYETNLSGGCIIPAGRNVGNPIPMIGSPQFSQLLDKLAENFDLVLIDAPPIGIVVDAAEIAKQCDGAVFVVTYNKTTRRDLKSAKSQMEQTGCLILGCIINQVTFDSFASKKYYNKTYYSHYNSDYYKSPRKSTNNRDRKQQ